MIFIEKYLADDQALACEDEQVGAILVTLHNTGPIYAVIRASERVGDAAWVVTDALAFDIADAMEFDND